MADSKASSPSPRVASERVSAPGRRIWFGEAGAAVPVAAMAVAIGIAALSWKLPHQRDFFDFRIYWAATRSWLDGNPLYSFQQPGTAHLGFTYPPFAGLALAPFSRLPETFAAWLLCGLSLAVLIGVAAGIGAAMARSLGLPRVPTVVVVLALSLSLEPVRESLSFGQINIVLLGLLVLDMWLITRAADGAGIATGLAAALKLTPSLLALVMLVRGRRAPGAHAAVAFVGASVLAWALAPTASRQYWTDKVWNPGRIGVARRFANQSAAGVIARLQHHDRASTGIWLPIAALLFVATVALVRAQRGPLGDVRALIIGAAAATALSPISWSHHYVWAVPALALAVHDAIGARRPWRWGAIGLAYLGFAYGPVFVNRYLGALPGGLVAQIRSLDYPAATVILCGLIAWDGIVREPHGSSLVAH